MKEIILAVLALLTGLAISVTISKRRTKVKSINIQKSNGDNSPNSSIINIDSTKNENK